MRPKHCPGLNRLAKAFAWDVGYLLRPATAALGGDGLTESQVNRLLASVNRESERIIDDCEELHRMLNNSLKLEYRLMKDGRSYVLPVIDSLRSLIDSLLEEVGAARKESNGRQ